MRRWYESHASRLETLFFFPNYATIVNVNLGSRLESVEISRRNSTGKLSRDRVTSYYSPFFPLSLKVSIKPAARRPAGKIEGNGGKAATSCLTLGYGIWGKRTSWFPRPTFHRDLASSAARSRSTSSHPPTHPPNFSLLSIGSQLVSTHPLSYEDTTGSIGSSRNATLDLLAARGASSISSGRG